MKGGKGREERGEGGYHTREISDRMTCHCSEMFVLMTGHVALLATLLQQC